MPEETPSRNRFYTVQEVAEVLIVSEETIRRRIRDGSLVALPIGHGYRIRQRDLDDFLDRCALKVQEQL